MGQKKEAPKRVPVTTRALLQRINRKYRRDFESSDRELASTKCLILKKAKTRREEMEFGTYYIIDAVRNFLSEAHISPEDLGRELGVLKAWEEVRD